MKRSTRQAYHSEKIQIGMPTRVEILLDWLPYLDDIIGWTIDIGEPTCWACGNGFNGRFDIENPNATIEQCYKAWESAPLHRCHIVPRSIGGSNATSNLFLMCEECHELSPDTIFCDHFFKWMLNQCLYKRQEIEGLEAFRSLGIDLTDGFAEKLSDMLLNDRDRLLHFCENKFTRHFSKISIASMVALMVEYMSLHQSVR